MGLHSQGDCGGANGAGPYLRQPSISFLAGLVSMKSIQIGAALAALVGVNALATAADASVVDYAAFRVGEATNTEVSGVPFDGDMTYGLAAGKAVGPFRVEVGVNRLQANLNLGGPAIQGEALDYYAGAYLDFNIGERASLFVGASADYVSAEANIFGFAIEGEGTGHAYAAGGAYRLTDNIIGEVQYRHLESDLSTDFGDVDLASDQITVGFRLAL